MGGPGKGCYAQNHLLTVQSFDTFHRPGAILDPEEAVEIQPASLCATRVDMGTGAAGDRMLIYKEGNIRIAQVKIQTKQPAVKNNVLVERGAGKRN